MSDDSTDDRAATESDGDPEETVDAEFAGKLSMLLAGGVVLFLVLPCVVAVGVAFLYLFLV